MGLKPPSMTRMTQEQRQQYMESIAEKIIPLLPDDCHWFLSIAASDDNWDTFFVQGVGDVPDANTIALLEATLDGLRKKIAERN